MGIILEEVTSNCPDLVLFLRQGSQDMGQIRNVVWYTREATEFLCETKVNTTRSGQEGW